MALMSSNTSKQGEKRFITHLIYSKALANQLAAPATEGRGPARSTWGVYLTQTTKPDLEQSPQVIIICRIPSSALAWAPSPVIMEVAGFCLHS